MLPAWTSPWNAPHRTVVRKKARTTCSTRGAGSIPNLAAPERSSMGTPSRNSMVSTLGPESSGNGLGTAMRGRSNSSSSSRKAASARASLRRSSSSPIWTRNPENSCIRVPADWSPVCLATISSSGCNRSRSIDTIDSMPGRRTFTATSVPSWRVARCTTAMEARPMGWGSKWVKASWSGIPRSLSMTSRTVSKGTAGPVSRQARNSSAKSSPNTPGDEATSCPNFM